MKTTLKQVIHRLKNEHDFIHTGVVIAIPTLAIIAVLSAFNADYYTAWNALGAAVITTTLYEPYHSVVKAIMKMYEIQIKEEDEAV